jgi:hypothetical protein
MQTYTIQISLITQEQRTQHHLLCQDQLTVGISYMSHSVPGYLLSLLFTKDRNVVFSGWVGDQVIFQITCY